MHLSNQQWEFIAPHIPHPAKQDNRGRPRRDDREILNGILWILRTGAPWKDMPRDKCPPYQTCHRRFQEWSRNGTLVNLLQVLAEDMQRRGELSLEECFIDGTFVSAKKGGFVWARRNVEKARKSWQFQTKILFQSPSLWRLLLHTKSPWWRKRLKGDLRKIIQNVLSEIEHTIAIR